MSKKIKIVKNMYNPVDTWLSDKTNEFKKEFTGIVKGFDPKKSNPEAALEKMQNSIESYLSSENKTYEAYRVSQEAAAFAMDSSISLKVDCSILMEQSERFLREKLSQHNL